MAGLGETISVLQKHRKDRGKPGGDGGGQFESVPSFGSNPGRLGMLVHKPPSLTAGAPLVVVLHGCTQSAAAFAISSGWTALADECGFAVIAPEQLSANNQNRCFNWFLPEDTRRGRGEAASIAAMIDYAISAYGLDSQRVFITGLSAGGAMTAAMLACYPELFAAGAIVAGLPYGVARNVSEAMSVMHRQGARSGPELGELAKAAAPHAQRIPRLSVWHGDADWTVNVANGVAIADQWVAVGGLDLRPTAVVEHPGFRRSEWCSLGGGEAAVQFNVVAGLGHGVPISARGGDGLGVPGPYSIEIGISSTREIAAFWGIAPTPRVTRVSRPVAADEPAPPVRPKSAHRPAPLGGQVLAGLPSHVPSKIADIITKALRSAGLMG